MFKSVKHIRVSDEIVHQVKTIISEGKLKPGDRLPPERELIKEFGVSRPSLREALNTLVAMGFLDTDIAMPPDTMDTPSILFAASLIF